jgi:hypothetical protein
MFRFTVQVKHNSLFEAVLTGSPNISLSQLKHVFILGLVDFLGMCSPL